MGERIELSKENFDDAISLAVTLLHKGEVIAVPTDTIYGVACMAQNTSALTKIYEIKKRDVAKPLAISLGDTSEVSKWAQVNITAELLNDLLPGPFTLIFKRGPELNSDLNPQIDSIGIRIPNSNFIRELSRKCGPLALTSANISSQPSAASVQEFDAIWPEIAAIFDGGNLSENDPHKKGSTVIDLTQEGKYKILREGCASQLVAEIMTQYNLEQR